MPIHRPTRRTVTTALTAAMLLPSAARAQDIDLETHQRNLLFGRPAEFDAALTAILERGHADMAPGLIFALRFRREDAGRLNAALAKLTGETGREGWFDWMLWQEKHPEIPAHPSYIAVKREVFLQIDPNFDVFLDPADLAGERMRIRFEEVTWGGVRKDGIPSLDAPDLIPAAEASYLRPDDLVFGVAINGDARAYPLRIMGWHEMFNDVIGGVPLALAYCTLCGSGILFETQLPGRTDPLIFGSSGFLYRSNKLMFDRATHSLWNQFTGEPVSGDLVDSGIVLRQRPVVIDTWENWQRLNPDTRVLSLDTGHRRDYGSGVVYREYFASDDLMFPTLVDESTHRQKDYVFGIRHFGGAKAWPLDAFDGRPVINDGMWDRPLVLIGDAATRSVRAYERGDLSFEGSADMLTDAIGTAWTVTEEALKASDGRTLPRVPGHVAYWFAWNGYLGAESELFDG